jgi:hypothetical protein
MLEMKREQNDIGEMAGLKAMFNAMAQREALSKESEARPQGTEQQITVGGLEFDLRITNAATEEVFSDDSLLLPCGTTLIVQPLPAASGTGLLTRIAREEAGLHASTRPAGENSIDSSKFYTITSAEEDDFFDTFDTITWAEDDEFVSGPVALDSCKNHAIDDEEDELRSLTTVIEPTQQGSLKVGAYNDYNHRAGASIGKGGIVQLEALYRGRVVRRTLGIQRAHLLKLRSAAVAFQCILRRRTARHLMLEMKREQNDIGEMAGLKAMFNAMAQREALSKESEARHQVTEQQITVHIKRSITKTDRDYDDVVLGEVDSTQNDENYKTRLHGHVNRKDRTTLKEEYSVGGHQVSLAKAINGKSASSRILSTMPLSNEVSALAISPCIFLDCVEFAVMSVYLFSCNH